MAYQDIKQYTHLYPNLHDSEDEDLERAKALSILTAKEDEIRRQSQMLSEIDNPSCPYHALRRNYEASDQSRMTGRSSEEYGRPTPSTVTDNRRTAPASYPAMPLQSSIARPRPVPSRDIGSDHSTLRRESSILVEPQKVGNPPAVPRPPVVARRTLTDGGLVSTPPPLPSVGPNAKVNRCASDKFPANSSPPHPTQRNSRPDVHMPPTGTRSQSVPPPFREGGEINNGLTLVSYPLPTMQDSERISPQRHPTVNGSFPPLLGPDDDTPLIKLSPPFNRACWDDISNFDPFPLSDHPQYVAPPPSTNIVMSANSVFMAQTCVLPAVSSARYAPLATVQAVPQSRISTGPVPIAIQNPTYGFLWPSTTPCLPPASTTLCIYDSVNDRTSFVSAGLANRNSPIPTSSVAGTPSLPTVARVSDAQRGFSSSSRRSEIGSFCLHDGSSVGGGSIPSVSSVTDLMYFKNERFDPMCMSMENFDPLYEMEYMDLPNEHLSAFDFFPNVVNVPNKPLNTVSPCPAVASAPSIASDFRLPSSRFSASENDDPFDSDELQDPFSIRHLTLALERKRQKHALEQTMKQPAKLPPTAVESSTIGVEPPRRPSTNTNYIAKGKVSKQQI